MGTYAGFFLPSILIPIFTLWAYYLSFLKYSFEALEQNEWADCGSYYMMSQFLSLDLTLNRWTNLLVLMAYPVIFHLAAVLSSLGRTGELPSCKPKCCARKHADKSSTRTPEKANDIVEPVTVPKEEPSEPSSTTSKHSPIAAQTANTAVTAPDINEPGGASEASSSVQTQALQVT
jgi:hypothetical protein